MISETIFWVSTFFFFWWLFLYCRLQIRKARERLKKLAFQFYVETGSKSRGFHYLSGAAVKAAERTRSELLRLELLARERAARQFTAVCTCPNCEEIDVHWLILDGRECRECGYKWYQK